jgi:HEAT repeat protein
MKIRNERTDAMADPILLTDDQMQRFVAHGYLCLQTTLPERFHRGIYDRFDQLIGGDANLNPGNNLLPACPEIGALFADPAVTGALTSVLGPDYVMHPHRALHNNPPGSDAQRLHKDSYWGYTRRVRNHRLRWVMIMYVPQATPIEQGPTGVVPGSQYQMRKPDESLMPEAAGCLPAGGFLLIHYDVWHRKMKNHTDKKRFMMKFEFIRMHEPERPTWHHEGADWRLSDKPNLDLSAVWRRQWDWLRHAQPVAARSPTNLDVARLLADADPHAVLKGINAIASDPMAVRTHQQALIGLLRYEVDPVGIDAGYALAAAGESAAGPLVEVILREDGEHIPEKRDGETAVDYVPNPERIARNALAGLVETGAAAVPGLLRLLVEGQARARKLAAFALGEIGTTTPLGEAALRALCAAASDPEAAVRVNAVEALGLLPATAGTVATLTAAVRDVEEEVRFSAALSLARLGPAADPAVTVLAEALQDSNRYVPGYAVEALERIGTDQAVRTLVPYLKNARWCARTSPASTF